VPWRTGGIVLRAVDQRASVLDASNLLEDAALDRYEFIRDGYMQRRNSKVLDTDKAQERADKVHEKLEKVQEKVESKLGVKLGPKPVPEDGADEPAAAPAEGSAPNNPPVPAPVSSEPASK
jgi:phospholipid-binding lipoprotein MlaA